MLHLHVLPWPDEPLPIVNLLGGEEGWIGSGISLAHFVPLPADTFSELTAQVFRGQSEGLFEARKRSDVAYNIHYRVFRDISESTNLDFGLSYGAGPNAASSDTVARTTALQAANATFRWRPLQTASYGSAIVRGEVFRSHREQPGTSQVAWGWFVSGDYRFSKRWYAGARIEASDHADDATRRDTGQAVTLTFWPSEFSQLRTELRRRRYSTLTGMLTGNEVLLQLQFAIGAHGAHTF